MTKILRLENIISGYEKGFSLKGINLTIYKSKFYGIIGPNGSGKSTLLKTMTGILKPFSGSIFLDEKDFYSYNQKQRSKKIAYVSQFVENKDIKVIDFILAGRLPHFKSFQLFETGKDREIAHKYMKIFDILHYENRYMYELSGGQQQVVAICSALAQEPEILFLDEPTAHLDLNYQIKILDLLQELNENMGLTIVCILHDLNLAAEYCSDLILLNDGAIFKSGKPEEIITYEILEEVYQTVIVTDINPVSKKPMVLPVSKNALKSSLGVKIDKK
ncbi:MAG: cobalamin transport system ATP-binding protein [Deferribacteres bacterium]|jgi:iron complex transport system ATP-binding protein|nr:transporter related protein [Deferribacteraceae bacterium]MDK2792409.1 cobalamin transport system ATP-binding protein [Deferribacteres bacterium]